MDNKQASESLADLGFVSVLDAAEFLGMKRTSLYKLIEDGLLPSVRIRGSRRVPKRALIKFGEQLLAAAK